MTRGTKHNPLYLHNNKQCGCYLDSEKVLAPPKHIRNAGGGSRHVDRPDEADNTECFFVNKCIYQAFLDGWDFTPDVGMGGTRGEIFTPRFIVDYMISDVGILPEKMVYNFDYSSEMRVAGKPFTKEDVEASWVLLLGLQGEQLGIMNLGEARNLAEKKALGLVNVSPKTTPQVAMLVDKDKFKKKETRPQPKQDLRYLAGAKVFEPAVGTGNYIATILYHKLELANELTGYKKTIRQGSPSYTKNLEQLARYQAYTLVVLASLYFNDIDPGNLQTTKWRILRDGEIANPSNIDFWVEHIKKNLNAKLQGKEEEWLREYVSQSIFAASSNWASKDRDRGVLDVLYEKHTGEHAPDWLRVAWRKVLDANAQLFNAIESNDVIEEGFVVPGNAQIIWTYWTFVYDLLPLDDEELSHLSQLTGKTFEQLEKQKLVRKMDQMVARRKAVPLRLQMLTGELEEVSNEISKLFAPLAEKAKALYEEENPPQRLDLETEDGALFREDTSWRAPEEKLDLSEKALLVIAEPKMRSKLRSLINRRNKINEELQECTQVSSLEPFYLYKESENAPA